MHLDDREYIEKLIKIKDITADNGRITLEGRVVLVDVRETRSGKGMIICELYDGTGIITCKSFSKDLKEGQEITEKIKNANAIKLTGKAGLDTYAGDVTVIAKTTISDLNFLIASSLLYYTFIFFDMSVKSNSSTHDVSKSESCCSSLSACHKSCVLN